MPTVLLSSFAQTHLSRVRVQVKRDKYAGMPRKKRRHLQRLEAWAKQSGDGDDSAGHGAPLGDGANTGSGKALGLPNQKLAARKAKVVERKATPGLKRSNPFADDSKPKKKKAPASAAATGERSTPGAKGARSQKAERALPPRKIRSRSKAKFSKPRKR